MQKPTRKGRASVTFAVLLVGIFVMAALIYITNLKGDPHEDNLATAIIFVRYEVNIALQAYKTDTGSLPTTKQGLLALIIQPEGVNGWKGPYLTTNDVPRDPEGNYYHYAFPSTHGQPAGKYDCWSLGPDGVNGTGDDIGNWPTTN